MVSGIYFFDFKANNNDYGQGLAVIDNGIVNGGDQTYLYRGRFDAYNEKVKASISVSHYRGPVNSVLGALREYTLELTGHIKNGAIDVSGGIPGMPQVTIRITGKKVAELYK